MAKIIRRIRFDVKRWLPEFLGGVAAIIGLVVPGWQAYVAHDHPLAGPKQGLLCFFGAFIILIGICLSIKRSHDDEVEKQIRADKDQKEAETRKQMTLLGATQVLCQLLRNEKGLPSSVNDGKIRVTIHRVELDSSEHGGQIQQMLPYVGGSGGSAGRFFSIKSGIIGKVVRTKQAYSDSRQTGVYGTYKEELIQKWGYTEQEAVERQTDRLSWMAVPLFGQRNPQASEEVIGVIYIDADTPDFFDEETQKFVISGCSGIKQNVDEVFATKEK